MARKLIAGNWKMNLLRDEGTALARDLALRLARTVDPAFDLLICPPATIIAPIAAAVAGSGLLVGGQDCHSAPSGAHTGDIAARMLADLGCSHVIVGHSERRQDHGEIDLMVAEKARAAQAEGMVAIICIGETEAERNAGRAPQICSRQIAGSLPRGATAENTVIAYEPIWAIGTGRTPTAAEVADTHAHIRAMLAVHVPAEAAGIRILYGGSVKPSNAAELLSLANVDGALVGGASLKADDFWAIAQAIAK
ncbi:triosephosphate isomerase [Inquilinus ginsengisoli]|uniref:Triosephosphate isomerase n=1 Tax=Inquilinus ginsengisoli TaxID=363840 RepID=A0ABU1JRX0_9PROT|nr:triose-phosphate isomerase [Inquilinus ginsengisoli]MDR6291362.1 triosephosphate isomerase [Inquilinus ginsengisoli]